MINMQGRVMVTANGGAVQCQWEQGLSPLEVELILTEALRAVQRDMSHREATQAQAPKIQIVPADVVPRPNGGPRG